MGTVIAEEHGDTGRALVPQIPATRAARLLGAVANLREDGGVRLRSVVARGDLKPGMTVVEYTGGSTGISLAFSDLPEVQVEGEHHSVLRNCLGEDLAVGRPLEPLVSEVFRIVTMPTQPLDDPHIQAHIREEAHLGGYRV